MKVAFVEKGVGLCWMNWGDNASWKTLFPWGNTDSEHGLRGCLNLSSPSRSSPCCSPAFLTLKPSSPPDQQWSWHPCHQAATRSSAANRIRRVEGWVDISIYVGYWIPPIWFSVSHIIPIKMRSIKSILCWYLGWATGSLFLVGVRVELDYSCNYSASILSKHSLLKRSSVEADGKDS